jgi:tRNA-dihydrouridine synthase C
LLGSDPQCLADNAARLAELGAEGIDLNFGCPAKTVNRHRGGAVLLDEPELVHAIVARRAARGAGPSAGVGQDAAGHRDDDGMLEAAQALAAGGADELVVHARTKLQGYRPPAYWDRVADIRAARARTGGGQWRGLDSGRCRTLPGRSAAATA